MTTPRKKRFPKKKPVEELTDQEVLKRLFPKKAREKMDEIAHEKRSKSKNDNK